MDKSSDELADLTQEIRRLIEENRKFLAQVMDEEFEPEDEGEDDMQPEEEL